MNDLLFRNRKFKLALLVFLGGLALAFMGLLDGQYIALVSIIMGAYNFANVAHKRISGNDISTTEK